MLIAGAATAPRTKLGKGCDVFDQEDSRVDVLSTPAGGLSRTFSRNIPLIYNIYIESPHEETTGSAA